MPRFVNHVNKNTGVTYVYEYASYWDKEKNKHAINRFVLVNLILLLESLFHPNA